MAVQTLSLRDGDRDPAGLAAALGQSLETTGFAVVADHGIDPALIAQAEAKARAFFALPDAEKRRFHVAGGAGQRGYTPFGTEAAKGSDAVDLKEFWHVGRALPAGHAHAALMPANVWPERPAGFAETMLALFAALEAVGMQLLAAIGRHLGLPAGCFDDAIRDGNSVLRLLHYPPIAVSAAGIRAAAHEDINTITLLLGAEEAGLELLTREGEWIAVAPPPGALVMNVGDMLQRLTNGRLRSTTHRVANPSPERAGRSRYSMPFFLHFRPDFVIEPLPGMGGGEPPAPITADAYLRERLREIGLL
ncbi:MAG: isopenicillin N synthase family oxygenase [Sphingomonadaceae bacterium]|nr:isopenicillin N synthase family oxygenase [Sphingomonadaceae bacterium]